MERVQKTPAHVYQEYFVPAVFGPWADELLIRATVSEGDRVLDLGCGTGVVTRRAAKIAGPTGRVTGLDFSPAMLAVAREIRNDPPTAEIVWIEGSADELPFPDASFDLVTAQQMLQFVPDRAAMLREVHRVLIAGGRIAIGVWAGPDVHPLHVEIDAIIAQHVGQSTLLAGLAFPDAGVLTTLIEASGLRLRSNQLIAKDAHFPNPATAARNFVLSSSAGIPGFRQLDVAERDRLIDGIAADLDMLIQANTADDEVIIPWTAHIVIAEKG